MKLFQRILAGSVLCLTTILGMVLLDFTDIAAAGGGLVELALGSSDEPVPDVPTNDEEEHAPVGVPEPGMLVLMGLGMLGTGLARCSRRFSPQYAKKTDSTETPAST